LHYPLYTTYMRHVADFSIVFGTWLIWLQRTRILVMHPPVYGQDTRRQQSVGDS
jgi:hypothetical protein